MFMGAAISYQSDAKSLPFDKLRAGFLAKDARSVGSNF
jgi:hypothetical protein